MHDYFSHLDLSYLKKESSGRKDIEKKMLEVFILQLKKFSREMNTLMEDGKWYLLGREAFFAKETIRIFGLHDMANELHKLDLLCRKHSPDDSKNLSSSVAVPNTYDEIENEPPTSRQILKIVQQFIAVANETIEEVNVALKEYE